MTRPRVDQFCYINRDKPYYIPEKHGFLLESASSLPWGMANILNGSGKELLGKMKDLNHWAGIETIIKSDGVGRITEDDIVLTSRKRTMNGCFTAPGLIRAHLFRAGAKFVQTRASGTGAQFAEPGR